MISVTSRKAEAYEQRRLDNSNLRRRKRPVAGNTTYMVDRRSAAICSAAPGLVSCSKEDNHLSENELRRFLHGDFLCFTPGLRFKNAPMDFGNLVC